MIDSTTAEIIDNWLLFSVFDILIILCNVISVATFAQISLDTKNDLYFASWPSLKCWNLLNNNCDIIKFIFLDNNFLHYLWVNLIFSNKFI